MLMLVIIGFGCLCCAILIWLLEHLMVEDEKAVRALYIGKNVDLSGGKPRDPDDGADK